MKKYWIFLTCSLLFFISKGQVISFFNLEKDTILQQIAKHLPSTWNMQLKDSLLIFEGKRPYVLLNSCDHLDTTLINDTTLRAFPKLVFRIEPKWTAERYYAVQLVNDSIWTLIRNLPFELGIQHLIDREKSTRFRVVFSPKTKEDKILIDQYEKKRKFLQDHVRLLPSFNTCLYSLTLIERTGISPRGKCVYPADVQTEANKVYVLFLEYARNPMDEY